MNNGRPTNDRQFVVQKSENYLLKTKLPISLLDNEKLLSEVLWRGGAAQATAGTHTINSFTTRLGRAHSTIAIQTPVPSDRALPLIFAAQVVGVPLCELGGHES